MARIVLIVVGIWLVLGLLAFWAFSSGGEVPGSGEGDVITRTAP